MASSSHQRRRPRARFELELPLNVEHRQVSRAGWLIGLVRGANSAPADHTIEQLNAIATDYATSRRLEKQRKSRPDALATLKLMGKLAQSLAVEIDCAGAETSDRIAKYVDLSSYSEVEPGLPHLEAIVSVTRQLEDVAATLAEVARSELGGGAVSHEIGELGKAAGDFWKRLNCSGCEWPLIVIQQDLPPEPWQEPSHPLQAIAHQLRWFAKAASAAFRIEASRRGPQSDTTHYRAVADLLRLYEAISGSSPTHSHGRGGSYTGTAGSAAGKWVVSAMQLIDPDTRSRGVLDAIEHAVWPSRRQRADQKARALMEAEGARIRQILDEIA